jgi:uncharacterized protein
VTEALFGHRGTAALGKGAGEQVYPSLAEPEGLCDLVMATTPLIVDVRCRMPSAADGAYFATRLGAARFSDPAGLSDVGFFSMMDAAGIAVAVSVTGNNQGLELGSLRLPPRCTSNDEQARLQDAYPGRFVGVAGIDVGGAAHDPIDELRRCATRLRLSLAGIEPGRAPLHADNPADRRIYPFYEEAQALGVTVMLQTSGLYGGKNLDYANPRWVDQVAEDFPRLRIVCGHGAHPFVREMIAVSIRRENVFPSPDLYIHAPSGREWVFAVNTGALADKLLFGSGFPLGGSLVRCVNRFLLLGFKPRTLDRILRRNALRALGLEDQERFSALAAAPDAFSAASVPRAALHLALHESARILRAPFRSRAT